MYVCMYACMQVYII